MTPGLSFVHEREWRQDEGNKIIIQMFLNSLILLLKIQYHNTNNIIIIVKSNKIDSNEKHTYPKL